MVTFALGIIAWTSVGQQALQFFFFTGHSLVQSRRMDKQFFQ
jgi:hypothetical protein